MATSQITSTERSDMDKATETTTHLKESVEHDDKSETQTLMDSDNVVDYYKHGTGPKVLQTLRLYEDDLRKSEKISWRVLDELIRAEKCLERVTIQEDEIVEEAHVKTRYVNAREWLINDAVQAVREYRQALLKYGEEVQDEAAQKAMTAMLHRDDEPKEPKTAQHQKSPEEKCSCGEGCKLALLAPQTTTPKLESASQEKHWIEALKSFDSDFRKWSAHFTQEILIYRYYISRGKIMDQNVLMDAGRVVRLAKGNLEDDEKQMHLSIPGAWVEDNNTQGDDLEDLSMEVLLEDFDDARVELLARNLKAFCKAIQSNSNRAEVDPYLLKAARKLIEQAGKDHIPRYERKSVIEVQRSERQGEVKSVKCTTTPARGEDECNLDKRLLSAFHNLLGNVQESSDGRRKDIFVLEDAVDGSPVPDTEPLKRMEQVKKVRWAIPLVEIVGERDLKEKEM